MIWTQWIESNENEKKTVGYSDSVNLKSILVSKKEKQKQKKIDWKWLIDRSVWIKWEKELDEWNGIIKYSKMKKKKS